DGHESERRVHRFVYDLEIEPVALGYRLPVMNARAAQWIDAEAYSRAAYCVHVDYVSEVAYVRVEIVVAVRGVRTQRLFIRNSLYTFEIIFQKLVRLRLDPGCDFGLGRSAARRIVLYAAVVGRVV